jgi:HAD superfamily hydrolase (TIGR01549 family)
MLKAVFFDFFGTLIFWTQPLHVTIRKLAERYGLELDWEVYPEAREFMTAAYEASTPTDNILETMERMVNGCRAFLKTLGVREHLEQMAWEVLQYEHAMFSRNNATLYDDVLPTLERLKGSGVKMAIVSNWDTPLHNTVETLGIDGYFDAIVASHDERVGSAKPDAGIFEYTLNALNVSKAEVVHVGDSYESDIVGADSAGIRAILLDRDGTQAGRWSETIGQLGELPELLIG